MGHASQICFVSLFSCQPTLRAYVYPSLLLNALKLPSSSDERKLTYFPPQASDIGSPELHVDHHNALFARVHTTFTRILRSHRCAHERSSEGTNFASYRLCTDRSCHWITSTCGWIAVESRGVCDTSTETFERGVQSGLLEAFDTRYLIW